MQQLQQHLHLHSINLNQAHAEPSRGQLVNPIMHTTEPLLFNPQMKEGLLMNTHNFLETSDLLHTHRFLSTKGKLATSNLLPAESHLTTHRVLLSSEGKLNTHTLPIAEKGQLNPHRLLCREAQLNTQISLALEGHLRTHATPPTVEGKLQIPLTADNINRLQATENELRLTNKTEGYLNKQTFHSIDRNSRTTSSENYKPNIPHSSPYYKPFEPINTCASNAQAECNKEVDHLSSIDKAAPRITIASSTEMTTASTELSMMGWRRFCSPPSVNVPARVAALHRQIVMISDLNEKDDSVHNSQSDHEVCLELNIGPSKGGQAHTGSKKTLQDIHSEDRSGFSKWKRPEPNKKIVRDTAQCLCNSGRTCWPEGHGAGSCICAQGSPLRFYLDNPNTEPVSTATSSNCNDPAISTDFKKYTSPQCAVQELVHAHSDRLLPTSILLQAAFPSEISCKRRKLDMQAHSNLTLSKLFTSDASEGGFHCKTAQNSIKRFNGMEEAVNHFEIKKTGKEDEDSPKLLAMIDLDCLRYNDLNAPRILKPIDTPHVQERSLVEFLHAKKQHRDHFLDKVVVKEDVYQSHPWNFTGGGQREPGGPVGSLYFCCSTKYTKRGNMTRNRMTKEGGRWKQQGMVQPIYYSSGGGGNSDVEAAHKTYLSYIPRGSCSKGRASFFVNFHNHSADNHLSCITSSTSTPSAAPGRLKHRHRMIEIALQEDLLLEKRSFQLKVTPKPFLVVCVLRNSTN